MISVFDNGLKLPLKIFFEVDILRIIIETIEDVKLGAGRFGQGFLTFGRRAAKLLSIFRSFRPSSLCQRITSA